MRNGSRLSENEAECSRKTEQREIAFALRANLFSKKRPWLYVKGMFNDAMFMFLIKIKHLRFLKIIKVVKVIIKQEDG